MASPSVNGYMKRANSFGSNGSLSGGGGSGGKNKNRPDLPRTGSRDNVRHIVEKEGKTARNLVVYSVPSEQKKKKFAANRTGRNRVKQNKKPLDNNSNKKQKSNTSKEQIKTYNGPKQDQTTPPSNSLNSVNNANGRQTKTEQYQEHLRKVIEKSAEGTKSERSNSVSSSQSQKNLRARYWSYLFDNFHRAVDEIYNTCEHDESVIECKEVIMMLDVCKRDFNLLIQRLELFSKLESSDVKDAVYFHRLITPAKNRQDLTVRALNASTHPIEISVIGSYIAEMLFKYFSPFLSEELAENIEDESGYWYFGRNEYGDNGNPHYVCLHKMTCINIYDPFAKERRQLDFDLNSSLCDLRETLKEQIGIPKDQQRLIFHGDCLNDDSRSLSSYGISRNGTIFLLKKHDNELKVGQNYDIPMDEISIDEIEQLLSKARNPIFRQFVNLCAIKKILKRLSVIVIY